MPTEEKNRQKFSSLYPEQYEYFKHYVENEELPIRFGHFAEENMEDFYIRKSDPFSVDVVVCVWLLGLFLRETRQMSTMGMQDYMRSTSNVVTLFMNILFVGSYGLKFYTIIKVGVEMKHLRDEEFWHTVNTLEANDTHTQESVYQTFYWLNNGNKKNI